MKLPKLHIRDLLWLILVCGLAVGWFVNDRKWKNHLALREEKCAAAQLAAHLVEKERDLLDRWHNESALAYQQLFRYLDDEGYTHSNSSDGDYVTSPKGVWTDLHPTQEQVEAWRKHK